MAGARMLESWVRAQITHMRLLATLTILFMVPVVILLMCLTACAVGVFVMFVAPHVGLENYEFWTTGVLTLGLLVLLWFQFKKYKKSGMDLINPINNDFGEEDGGLAAQVCNSLLGIGAVMVAGIGMGGIIAPGRSTGGAIRSAAEGQGAMTLPKVITFWLFLVPETMQTVVNAYTRNRLLAKVNAADITTAFEVLLGNPKKVPFSDFSAAAGQFEDVQQACTDLAHFNGVLFLVAPPAGIGVTGDLRRELLDAEDGK
ncbi:MAG: hypothetical protein ACREJ2_03805 [Planctomycetota bacterium]